ncbi:hypothetical protein [Streptomyces sp. NPDC003635]
MEQYQLTDGQKKAFEDNEAEFRKLDGQMRGVRESARARLSTSGWEPDSSDGRRCLSCPCPDYQGGGPQGGCKRLSCRHPLLDHDMDT